MGNYITNKMKFTIIALLGCASAIRLSSKDDGFEVDILAQGEGDKVPDGAEVEMNYTGTLLDGTKFDSSLDHGKTFKFHLGQHEVISCWDQGVAQLSKGAKAKFTCPSDMAYGEKGAGDAIPPNATLNFEVEVVNFTQGSAE